MAIKINAAARLKASTKIFYRGLQETWNESKAKNQHLTFVTEDRDYALEYAKDEDHLLSFHVDVKHPFDFGFRTLTTSVSLSEVVARIRKGIMSQFQSGHVSKEKGLALIERLKSVDQSGHKEVWEWYMKVPELSAILEEAGYDCIKGNEGAGDDIVTYGVFDPHKLKPVRN